MKTIAIAALLAVSTLAGPVGAQQTSDASVKVRLAASGIKYEIDGDGDYKVTYSYSKDNRTQLVFVSGATQTVGSFQIREIYSPAARVEKDSIMGSRAFELLKESRGNKIGSWEVSGDVLYFVIKLPESLSAAQLESAMDIASETADDMELELTGRDDL